MQRRKLRKFTNQILLIQKKPFTGALLSSCPKKKIDKAPEMEPFYKTLLGDFFFIFANDSLVEWFQNISKSLKIKVIIGIEKNWFCMTK